MTDAPLDGQAMLCVECFEPTTQHPLGRPRHYCSPRCRVRHHRRVGKMDRSEQNEQTPASELEPETVRDEQLTIPIDTPTVTE